MKGAPKMALTRTPAVEEILAEIWTLRPELKCKNTMTLLLGLQSFLHDCRSKAIEVKASPTVETSPIESNLSTDDTSEITPDSERPAGVSDDIEW